MDTIKTLTFDVNGTMFDLRGSLTPYIADFLQGKGLEISADAFWTQWRGRQRVEQYQDTMMTWGHSGYLETTRRSFVYTLGLNRIEASPAEVATFLDAWQHLKPFPEVRTALERLKERFHLVILSNIDRAYVEHLVTNRLGWSFDQIFTVDSVGAFKPHPVVYRGAIAKLGLEANECMMVSAHSFDVAGAKSCGFRGTFVNRYKLPYEDTDYLAPDFVVADFHDLANTLLA